LLVTLAVLLVVNLIVFINLILMLISDVQVSFGIVKQAYVCNFVC